MVDSYTRLPIYRATARVLIEDANNDIATPTEISRSRSTWSDPEIYMRDAAAHHARPRPRAARARRSWISSKVAEFNGQGPKPTQLARGIATVKYYAMWPYRLITSSGVGAAGAAAVGRRRRHGRSAPQRLMGRVGVAQVRGSQLVDLTYDAADPVFAARAVNAFADEYVSENLSLKFRPSRRAPSG